MQLRKINIKTMKENNKQDRIKAAKTKKWIIRYGSIFVILVLVVYGISFLASSTGPESEDFSISYPSQGRNHIANDATHIAYNSNPPSSGPHYVQPVRGGFYSEAIPDEAVVHNLEHGDIWITYNPAIDDASKAILEKFAGRYVVVSPRTENEGDVSLVAWGRVDTFSLENGVLDEERIKNFISRYDNKGPENVRF